MRSFIILNVGVTSPCSQSGISSLCTYLLTVLTVNIMYPVSAKATFLGKKKEGAQAESRRKIRLPDRMWGEHSSQVWNLTLTYPWDGSLGRFRDLMLTGLHAPIQEQWRKKRPWEFCLLKSIFFLLKSKLVHISSSMFLDNLTKDIFWIFCRLSSKWF